MSDEPSLVEPVAGPSSAGPSSAQPPPPDVIGNDELTDDDGEYLNRIRSKDEVLNQMNLVRLTRQLGTKEQCVAYSEEQGLVKTEMRCPGHRAAMRITYASSKTLGSFVCSKGSCGRGGNRRVCRSDGTFFKNINIPLPQIYYLIYAFAHNWSVEQTQHEDPHRDEKQTCLSATTIVDWNNHCREAIIIYYMEKINHYTGKIGGPGKVVQIDESKFGKGKYNKGHHIEGHHIEGHWVLGMIENDSEDLRLEVCPDNIRLAEVLVPLIQKHVEVGTTIHTDSWRAYDCLGQCGYTHKKVNHSDPDSPVVAEETTPTQINETQWRAVKRQTEYLWRRNVKKLKIDPFEAVMSAIRHVYNA